MSRGKSTCKVLKEVRRKIADANNIPLQERECTHTGDCAGTCPYCESEVRYLERELSKRRALGKAVAVAGIALSAVTMAGCATSEPVTSTDKSCKTSGRHVTETKITRGIVLDIVPKENVTKPNTNKNDIDTVGNDTFTTAGIIIPFDPRDSEDQEPASEYIPGFHSAIFKEGNFEEWLGNQLIMFRSYMQDSRLDDAEIRFFVEEDGTVTSVNILNMPHVYNPEDEKFHAKVIAVISGSEWAPATDSDGKPVSSIVTVRLRDLR